MRDARGATLRADGIGKNYDLRPVLSGISFDISQGEILGIAGSNGSGKSTLMKILANVLERSAGEVAWEIDAHPIDPDRLHPHIGFVSPYLNLYTEFTGREHLLLLNDLRGSTFSSQHAESLIERFGLQSRFSDRLGDYSSGMFQRAKLILALAHDPAFLFLDEPATNLDEDGIRAMYHEVETGRAERVTVIASNDANDLDRCSSIITLGGE